ncbi:MAG: hypothetical protein R3B09_31295 [Nannocystaceae bacterium]
MASGPGPRRRLWTAALFVLWLLEWVLGWSEHLGPLTGVIELLWLCGLAYFVIEGRSGRLPRALHTWGWMLAVLAIAALRALWIGDAGLLLFTEIAREADPAWISELAHRREFTAADAVATSLILGLVIGLAGLVEAAIIAAMSKVGDLFRERREPARVGLLPRIAVTALQAPIFLALMGFGLACLAGALGTLAHPGSDVARPGADLRGWIEVIALVGGGAWALAVVHLRRLEALAAGGAASRWILAAFALAGALAWAAASGPSPGGVALAALWLIAQLGALRWARPAPAAASPARPQ